MNTQELTRDLKRMLARLKFGCGNHLCRVVKPTGMGTNGKCQCSPRGFSNELLRLALETEQLGSEWPKQ